MRPTRVSPDLSVSSVLVSETVSTAMFTGLKDFDSSIRFMASSYNRHLAGARRRASAVLSAGRSVANARGSRGTLAVALKGLGQSLAKLREALGPTWQRTTVIAVTEFGRTVAVNGTGGTDHGTGTVALLLGGNVAGGRVIADWPGLAAKQLYQGRDLAPTFDLRAALKTICRHQLEIDAATVENRIFPDSRHAAAQPGLLRA